MGPPSAPALKAEASELVAGLPMEDLVLNRADGAATSRVRKGLRAQGQLTEGQSQFEVVLVDAHWTSSCMGGRELDA